MAFSLFAKGYTNADVAKKIRVNKDTAASYRTLYEQRIHAQAAANPSFLRDVLANTMRALEELDQIRSDAWKQISEDRYYTFETECDHCGEDIKKRVKVPIGDDNRVKYQNVLLKAQDQRSKILGVLGVKAEVIAAMTQIKIVQDQILRWLTENVEGELRDRLETFLTTELREYMDGSSTAHVLDVIDIESVQEVSA